MKLTILIISILLIGGLIGCNTQTEEEKEDICKTDCLSNGWQYGEWIGLNLCNCYNATTIKEIETIKEVKIPCNLTCPSKERELELIRRLKFLEDHQDDLIINETECMPHNITEEKLQNCKGKIDMYKRDIEELEDELEICEEEICGYNSSWC